MKIKIDLDQLPEFLALDTKRQTVARGISQGVSYSKAVGSVGLNPTRERRNEKLQRVLWILKMGATPEGKPPATTTGEPSIYDLADALGREMETWSAEKLAAFREEREREYPRDKNYPCHFCGKSCERALGLCPACCPDCRCNSADCPRSAKCRESKPAPPPKPAPTAASPVTRRCRTCGLPAGPRDIVCTDPTCVGAVDTF